jgi:hypothetical protein
MDRQGITRFDQVSGHGVAHVAKANKENVWKFHVDVQILKTASKGPKKRG